MLSPREIAEIGDEIVRQISPRKIILFGSYADGSATEDSDLDLLVVNDSEEPSRTQNRRLRRMLGGRGVPIDVFVKSTEEFETYKDIVGTILYPAHRFGRVLYDAG